LAGPDLDPAGGVDSSVARGDAEGLAAPPELGSLSEAPVYTIGALSRRTGIEPVTLRAWERRYGVPRPGRTESGYRLYSERDAAILRWIKERIGAGIPVGRAAAILRSGVLADTPSPDPLAALQGRLLRAAGGLDEPGFERALAEGFATLPLEDACLRLIAPFLVRLGEAWARGEISVAGEHFASQIMRRHLLALLAAAPVTRGPLVLLGCPPAEQHELGGLMFAIFCRRRGIRVTWLGADLPAEEWVSCCRALRVLLAGLSVVGSDGIAGAREVVERLGALPEGERPILTIGGFGSSRALVAELGVRDLGETALEASGRIAALVAAERRGRRGEAG
jgi:DNA-binding transcriptional MerR regulator/methanogenic corrinoid protein MtbC1